MMVNMAVIGAAVGVIASTWVHILAKKREERIWDVVNEDRIRINRIQTAIKWRRYGDLFDPRDEDAKEMTREIIRRERAYDH